MGNEDVSETHLKAILYTSSLIYGVVTAYIGLSFLDGIVQTITWIMAALGSVVNYIVLKKVYENQHGIKL